MALNLGYRKGQPWNSLAGWRKATCTSPAEFSENEEEKVRETREGGEWGALTLVGLFLQLSLPAGGDGARKRY